MPRIKKFAFRQGDQIDKYKVLSKIGDGWEGEVYLVREKGTGVPRAAKLFYPHRDKKGGRTKFTARKLHKLRHCGVLIQYHHVEEVEIKEHGVHMMVSEFVEGKPLSKMGKLHRYEALHLLRALAQGMVCVHDKKEYHGDIHEHNVLVTRRGAWFDIKVLDLYDYGKATAELIAGDVVDMIEVFKNTLRGSYASQPQWVKDICCGGKHTLIRKKFKNAKALVHYLDNFSVEQL